MFANCLDRGFIQGSPLPPFKGPLMLIFLPPAPPPWPQPELLPWDPALFHTPPSSSSSQLECRFAVTWLSPSPQPSCIDFEPGLMGLGEGFPQPDGDFPESSGSPQPVLPSLGLHQAAVPLSTGGPEGALLFHTELGVFPTAGGPPGPGFKSLAGCGAPPVFCC